MASMGSGFYLAAMLVSMQNEALENCFATGRALLASKAGSLVFSCLFCVALLLLRNRLCSARAQKAAIVCSVVAWAVYILLDPASAPYGFRELVLVAKGFTMMAIAAFLMSFWGLVFAGMSRKAVITVVTTASLVACLCNAACSMLAPYFGLPAEREALYFTSTVLLFFLNKRVAIYDERRTWRNPRKTVFFYASRAACGLAMGFVCSFAAVPSGFSGSDGGGDLAFLMIPTALVLVAVVVELRNRRMDSYLALMPAFLAISQALSLTVRGSFSAVSTWGLVWIAWILLSYSSLSGLKHDMGYRETTLCLTEKVVVMLFWALGIILFAPLVSTIDAFQKQEATAMVVAVSAAAAFLVFSCMSLTDIARQRRREAELSKAISKSEIEVEAAVVGVVELYGLTTREAEIVSCLIKGYTRSRISAMLMIADSTVKTHVEHIYKKLGCHKRSELIDIVEGEKKRASE